MLLDDYRFDGMKKLKLKEMPTDAGEYLVQKSELNDRTKENMIRAAALQETLYKLLLYLSYAYNNCMVCR